MTFELSSLIEARQGENFRLHSEYLNPQLVKVLKTLGFDRFYVRGEGSYLYDRNGERYLDFLAGFGVFALGRGHPGGEKGVARGARHGPPEPGSARRGAAARTARRGVGGEDT